ncbi:hypothetical protein AAIH46_11785 [Rhizobium sp. 0TCS1.26]|uniref:hypothetical protein n=1 Tax=Rhizobium sp. 0TCS1.26 TaxID=3142623 RepID=UPI003D2E0D2C
MSGLETAIRNALARSDRGDANVRARIYQSARQALEAGLRKQEITDPEVIEAQRRRLEENIREIEFEERRQAAIASAAPVATPPVTPAPDPQAVRAPIEPPQAVAPQPPAVSSANAPAQRGATATSGPALGGQSRESAGAGSVSAASAGYLGGAVDTPADRAPGMVPQPGDGLGELGAMRAEPSTDRLAPVVPAARAKPEKRSLFRRRKPVPQPKQVVADTAPGIPGEHRRRRRRGLISRLFIYLTFFAFLAMGGWWAYTSGLFLSPAERDTSVPNPPAQVQEEDFPGAPSTVLDPRQGFSSEWLNVYRPGGAANAVAGAEASVETVPVADGSALQLTSRATGSSGDVAIPVPVEILQQMAGKTSTIAITLQAVGDNAVQLAVRCDFASLGDCSRHRVMATQERSDTLFRVTFDRTLAPTQPGRIFVNSDILGSSQPILIYSVRVLPGQ